MPKTVQKTSTKPKPRERLLEAARKLFYEKGYAIVGINEVIEAAEVAKASFYHHFPSKDELIYACLDRDHHETMALLRRFTASLDSPRMRVLAVYDACAQDQIEQGFRGSHFTNALAALQHSTPKIRDLANWHTESVTALFAEYVKAWELREGFKDIDIHCLSRVLTSLLQGATLRAQVALNDRPFAEAAICADALLKCAADQSLANL